MHIFFGFDFNPTSTLYHQFVTEKWLVIHFITGYYVNRHNFCQYTYVILIHNRKYVV